MPNCFTLRKKEVEELSRFNDIDDEMRLHFGAEPDETNYYRGWYDSIGFAIAMGRKLGSQELRDVFKGIPELLEVIDWLEEHYTSDAWAQIGRR